MEVLFREGDKNGMKELMAAVRNNSFGDFDVDPDALKIVKTGTVYTILLFFCYSAIWLVELLIVYQLIYGE